MERSCNVWPNILRCNKDQRLCFLVEDGCWVAGCCCCWPEWWAYCAVSDGVVRNIPVQVLALIEDTVRIPPVYLPLLPCLRAQPPHRKQIKIMIHSVSSKYYDVSPTIYHNSTWTLYLFNLSHFHLLYWYDEYIRHTWYILLAFRLNLADDSSQTSQFKPRCYYSHDMRGP